MPKKFNLEDYDLVQNRIQKFYKDEPKGRIITELVEHASNVRLAVFKASVYLSDTLIATGWASEEKDMELKTSNRGSQYESINFSSHLENAETSSIGRALANMGRHGNKRASREEMQAVERAKANDKAWRNAVNDWFGKCQNEQEVVKMTEWILKKEGIDNYRELVKTQGQELITKIFNKEPKE